MAVILRTLLFILIFILISCGSKPKATIGIEGKYSLYSEEAFGELEILKNHRFKYKYAIGLINTKSEEIWKKNDNELVLTSDLKYEINKIDVIEVNSKKQSEIIINYKDGNPVVMANLIINKDKTKLFTTDENGKIILPKNSNISSFTVFYLGESYDYEANESKSFKIILSPDDLGKTYFNNKIFQMKRNKIIDSENNWKYYKVKY